MKKVSIYIIAMILSILLIPTLIISFGKSIYFDDPGNLNKTGDSNTTDKLINISGTNPRTPLPVTHDKSGDYVISVYNAQTENVFQIPLEEYIVSVVIAEMPASFEIEAIKAQAVAARTYTYKRLISGNYDEKHKGAAICTDSSHCQAWTALEKVIDSTPDANGNNAIKAAAKIEKVRKAVTETAGLIACYNEEPIEALYHSCSGGMTEYAEKVWDGKGYPYLKPVKSSGEEIAANKYKTAVNVSPDDFLKKLEKAKSDFSSGANDLKNKGIDDIFQSIKNITRSDSGRVLTLKIGGVEFTGRDMRKIFGLNSTNITFSVKDNKIVLTTLGYGHGVGLSQYGANARAKEGMKFKEILKFYYTGIDIKKI